MKKLIDDFDISDYLNGCPIYSSSDPKSCDREFTETDEAYIPEDVLNGKREWKLTWDREDPRNKDGILIMKEKS